MTKQKKDEKKLVRTNEQSADPGRRAFLERTGLTAGGVLMGTLAAGGISKGQTVSPVTQERLMSSDTFKELFDAALTDKVFQDDILAQGFEALEARGYTVFVPQQERTMLEQSLVIDAVTAKPRCGICGVCGACGLCAEVNLGSASAALWALFTLK